MNKTQAFMKAAKLLVEQAAAAGVLIRIDTVSVPPLAMGRVTMSLSVREAREAPHIKEPSHYAFFAPAHIGGVSFFVCHAEEVDSQPGNWQRVPLFLSNPSLEAARVTAANLADLPPSMRIAVGDDYDN